MLEWGRKRVEVLCRIWKQRRAADKLKAMEDKLAPFAVRVFPNKLILCTQPVLRTH